MRPADRPTGIVAAKYDVTIQIPAYHAPPRRTATINKYFYFKEMSGEKKERTIQKISFKNFIVARPSSLSKKWLRQERSPCLLPVHNRIILGRERPSNHSNPGTPDSYFKQYLAEALCFPAKSRPPPPLPGIQLTGALFVVAQSTCSICSDLPNEPNVVCLSAMLNTCLQNGEGDQGKSLADPSDSLTL